MLSSNVYFFLSPVGFSFKRRNSSEKVFNLLFITDLNNLPKQLKIVIGRKFLGSVFAPLFLLNGSIYWEPRIGNYTRFKNKIK